ncbi:methyl-accepting chemotaxis protein [Paenibacillus lemnae]|uniref:Methyl-accepting transducer domain-containing protein n=1 Tax=Paenibacillus lemnae TaxID=1330551 RepID=A0A848M671_PAELE|nr:methyl-accepting chemotaxis protein [Paenibacillus lemnae]NMO96648.1 hypothetical protein [Paenibacillus lemnae]
MDSFDFMRLKDTSRKNTLMFITMGITLAVVFIYSMIEGSKEGMSVFGGSFALLACSYIILNVWLKKPMWFPLAAILGVYSFAILGNELIGGSVEALLIVFFLLVFSSLQLNLKWFLVGYVYGVLVLIMNNSSSTDETLRNAFGFAILLYLLMGVLFYVLIRMTDRQFQQVRELQLQAAQDAEAKSGEKKLLEERVSFITDRIQSMNDRVQEHITSQREMAAAVDELAKGGQTQSEQITSIASNASQSKEGMESLRDASNELKVESEEVRVEAGEGRDKMSRLLTDMHAMKEVMAQLSQSYTGLATVLKETTDMTEVIKGITEQTNLLALNASIEAARAGDAGNGFGVVAGEIRKLATLTAQTTEQITANLSALNQGSDWTYQSMMDCQQKIGESVFTTEEVSSYVEKVAMTLTRLDDNLLHFASLSEQVMGQSSEIEGATGELASIIEQASASLEEMSASIETLRDDSEIIAQDMNEAAAKAKEITNYS